MKKTLFAILAMAAALSALTASAETVQIASAADWAAFANRVNTGETTLNARMAADVTLTPDSPRIGDADAHAYAGTFDGGCHKLTVNWNTNGVTCLAPFAWVSGATISNLYTTGAITADSKMASGMIGQVRSNGATISMCRSSVCITNNIAGDATTGGFIGCTFYVSQTINITDCLFDGSLICPNGNNVGGFVGYTFTDTTVNVERCLFNPQEVILSSGDGSKTFVRGVSLFYETCYYTTAIGDSTQGNISWMSARALAEALGDNWTVKNDKAMPAVFAFSVPDGGVQLWENGPIWAEYNVGANSPEDYGYYFWWGDTIGYRRVDDAFKASDGSSSDFSFVEANAATSGKTKDELISAGYIDATGKLVAAYDAATVRFGSSWRLPSIEEFQALVANCTATWTTQNGVHGYLVTGRGAYADKSIFLPAAGRAAEKEFYNYPENSGFYWASERGSSSSQHWSSGLNFKNDNFGTYTYPRERGQSVRAVFSTVNFTFVSEYATVGAMSYLIGGGAAQTAPSVNRENYRFQGYYTAETGGVQIFDANRVLVQSSQPDLTPSMTLYAQWKIATVNFTFVSGGVTTGTASYDTSGSAPVAQILTRRGNDRFLGYFTEQSGGTQVYDENYEFVESSLSSLSPDTTLYARWQLVPTTMEGGITRLVYRGVLTNFGEWTSGLKKTMHVKVYDSASATTPLWSGDVANVPINPDGSFEAVFGNDDLALAFASNDVTHVELTVGDSLSPLAPRRAFASVASVNRAVVAEGAASDIKVGTLGAKSFLVEKVSTGSLEASGTVRVEGSVSVEVKPFDIERGRETTIWRGAGVTAWGNSSRVATTNDVVAGQLLWTSDREGVAMIHCSGPTRSTLRIPATIQFVRPGDEVRAPTYDSGEVGVTVWEYKK